MSIDELVRRQGPVTDPVRPSVRAAFAGVARTARPQQWTKNVLVLAAPLAAASFGTATLRSIAAVFAAFCLAASAVYFCNDSLDAEADRRHPDKRHRPIAAGVVPLPLAWAMAASCAGAALGLAAAATNLATVAVIAAYLAVNVAYCARLKHVVVLDLALVSSGFLLRALAGAAAAELEISRWFLLVAGFGSLFVVAGKRYSELVVVGHEAGSRRSLAGYSVSYLRFVWGAAAAVTLTAYCLWAFEVRLSGADTSVLVPWQQLSVVPFTLSMLCYAYVVDSGRAGKPEQVLFGSPVLPLLGAVWLLLFGLGALHV